MAFRHDAVGVMLSGMRAVFPLALRLSLGRCLLFQFGLLATVFLLGSGSAFASSTIFGGGPFYTGGQARMNELRNSGYTTVMLWTIHLNENNGDLIYNDILVVSNGVYVGNPAWPGQLATLKQPPTSVNRIEISVGSWGVPDFERIKILMDTYGTNTTSILYRNFQALKAATGADAVDFDDESQYDVNTMVKFGRMLSSIGYKVTLCPYTQPTFWQNVYNQLGPAIVDEVYLQCYAGGAGNNPATWNNYFPGLKVQPGMWSRHGGGCADGSTAAEVQAQMTSWRNSAGITGGFMWLYDDMLSCTVGGTAADYARAINTAVDKMLVLPAAGFTGVTAFNSQYIPTTTPFTLTNSGATALNWSVINTSSWLTVSAASGALPGYLATTVNISLNPAVATNLVPSTYPATVLFSNVTTKVTQARNFSLNTAIANWPVALTGFNAGILASNTATAGNPTATAFDVKNNYGFYQLGLPGSTRGLPLNGVFASKADSSTAFQVGPFGKTNALMLGYTYPIAGTLTLPNPQAFSSLAILASSANGGGQGTFVLNFTNGTKSPVFNFNAPDWFFNVNDVAGAGFRPIATWRELECAGQRRCQSKLVSDDDQSCRAWAYHADQFDHVFQSGQRGRAAEHRDICGQRHAGQRADAAATESQRHARQQCHGAPHLDAFGGHDELYRAAFDSEREFVYGGWQYDRHNIHQHGIAQWNNVLLRGHGSGGFLRKCKFARSQRDAGFVSRLDFGGESAGLLAAARDEWNNCRRHRARQQRRSWRLDDSGFYGCDRRGLRQSASRGAL
jgi:hypothetical protein